jgi:hypothetical protein
MWATSPHPPKPRPRPLPHWPALLTYHEGAEAAPDAAHKGVCQVHSRPPPCPEHVKESVVVAVLWGLGRAEYIGPRGAWVRPCLS